MFQSRQAKLLVLYADDDPDDIQYVNEAFQEYADNIELLAFSDATTLLQCIRTRQITTLPCLVILDINMPRLDGKQALKMLRNIEGYESVPVVLFSTSTSTQDARFAKENGAEFISKPLNQKQMQIIVTKFLERCRQEAEKNQE